MSLNQVAVVILNWNGKAFLEKFLPDVLLHSQGASIYVADNHSSDDSVAYLRLNFPQVSVISNAGNEGFAKGYNLALKHVDAKYFVLLNSDVEVTPNWLSPVIHLMEHQPDIGACQPKILDYYQREKFEYAGAAGGFIDAYGYPFCRGRIFNVLENDEHQYDEPAEIFWATGACMFVRSEAFWKVGGFDDDYFAHMEEIDVCWRMQNVGYKIYAEPKSVIYHIGGGTLNKLSPRKTYLNFRNNLTTFTKNSAPKYLVLKIIYRMVLDGVAAWKFLLEGHGLHFFAVLKAHGAYYKNLKSTLKKRRVMKHMEGFHYHEKTMYKTNIVYLHFIKSVKVFSEIGEFLK